VPPQLQNLIWIEELLITRAHLTGRIIRLQNRNAHFYFNLKGHVILLPQDIAELLNILPLPSSSLPDIIRIYGWDGLCKILVNASHQRRDILGKNQLDFLWKLSTFFIDYSRSRVGCRWQVVEPLRSGSTDT
jgi:hypothetical protein